MWGIVRISFPAPAPADFEIKPVLVFDVSCFGLNYIWDLLINYFILFIRGKPSA